MGSLVDTVLNVVSFGAYGQKEAQKKATAAQQQADMEARRIAASQKPMEESATLLTDTWIGENTLGSLGSLGLMVDPTAPKKKQTAGLSTTGSTGLSTTASTSLGFGS